MKATLRTSVLAGLLLVQAATAQDQIPWVADFRSACELAAEQRRLVLIHFYNDNCPPCLWMEQNVFNQRQVADAVAQNYIPIKVHAGKQPDLASRYQITRWPQDVIVTPSGLEVQRSTGKQKPADYITLVNQVAQKTGTSNLRQWTSRLDELAQAVKGPTTASAKQVEAIAPDSALEAKSLAQNAASQSQVRWNNAVRQFDATANRGQAAATQATDQTFDKTRQFAQQTTATAQEWSQQATEAANQYKQQAGNSYRQLQEQAADTGRQIADQAKSVEQTAQSAGEQVGDSARTTLTQWQQSLSQSGASLRSAFVPTDSPQQAESKATAMAAATEAAPSTTFSQNTATEQTQPPQAETQPPLPAVNPWIPSRPFVASYASAAEPAAPPAPVQSPPPAASAAPAVPAVPQLTLPRQPVLPATPALPEQPAMPPQPQFPGPRTAWPAAPAETVQGTNFAPTTNARSTIVSSPSVESQVIPASQAPPVALDGYCAVTLIEKGAWQKADPKFGAIHRGQTYLFLSSAEQRRFLANPDHYVLPPAALDGYCPVTLRDGMKWQKGDRQQLAIHRGRTYFFAGAPERESFLRNADAYAPMLSGCDPVRLAQRGEAVEGKRAYGLRTPDGRIVLFADEQALEQYKKSPGAYTAAAYQAFQRTQGGATYR